MHPSAETPWWPAYSHWCGGGWYVNNIRYPNGSFGLVSNNFPDCRWRIVHDPRRVNGFGAEGDFSFCSRDEAALAERDLAAFSRWLSDVSSELDGEAVSPQACRSSYEAGLSPSEVARHIRLQICTTVPELESAF